MKKVPLQDLPLQYQTLKEELAPEIEKVLVNSAYIQGPAVSRFEEDFASYIGTKYAVKRGELFAKYALAIMSLIGAVALLF